MLPQDETKSVFSQPKAAPAKGAKGATKTATTPTIPTEATGTKPTGTKSSPRAAPRKARGAQLSDELQQRIQQRAYELWEHEGRPQGREDAHWEQAEREITGRSAGGRA